MVENSITVRIVLYLWNALLNSKLYFILVKIMDFFAQSYKISRFRKFLKNTGNVGRFVETSLFYKVLSAFCGVFIKIGVGIFDLIIKLNRGGLFYTIYQKIGKSSFLLDNKTYFPLVLLLIFAVPHDNWNNAYALIAALFLCVMYVYSLAQKKEIGSNIKSLSFPLLLFFFAIGLSVVNSCARSDSIRIFVFFITAFLLCLITTGSLNTKEAFLRYMQISYFVLMLMSVIGVVQGIIGVEADASLTDLSLNEDMPGRVYGTLGNPNNYAEYLMLFMPYGFAYAVTRKNKDSRFLHTAFMLLPLAAILLTYSRSGWIALAVAVFVYILLYNYRYLPVLFIGGVCAIPFVPRSVLNRILTIGNTQDTSSSYRIDIWTGCIEMLKKHWFAGIGLGPEPFGKIFPPYAIGESGVAMHSHMQFMEMLIEGGILLFVSYLWLVISLIKKACVCAVKCKDAEFRQYLIAGAASITGLVLIGCFEYCWFYPRVIFAFFISAGISLASVHIFEKEQ